MTSLEKIEGWLDRRGYSTLFDDSFEWEARFKDKLIVGNRKMFKHESSMIAVLLHECGHVDQLLDPTWKWYRTPKRKNKKPKDSYYISVLDMEMDAWKRAEKIAEELGIRNLKKAFRRTKFWRLMTYVEWAAGKGDPSLMQVNKSRKILKKQQEKSYVDV